MPSFMLPSGGGPSKVTTENFTAGNIKTGVTIIVKYRGKDLYKVLGTFTNDANATAADILNTKTAYVNGNKVTGSMPNIGAVSQSLAINGTYNVPKGYHNGSGRVTQSIPTQGAKTITPNTRDQRVTAGRYLTGDITVKGDGNLVAGNIKSGVSIFGVWGSYTGSVSQACVIMSHQNYDYDDDAQFSITQTSNIVSNVSKSKGVAVFQFNVTARVYCAATFFHYAEEGSVGTCSIGNQWVNATPGMQFTITTRIGGTEAHGNNKRVIAAVSISY